MSIKRTDGAAALQSGHSADTRQPETDATMPQPGHDAAARPSPLQALPRPSRAPMPPEPAWRGRARLHGGRGAGLLPHGVPGQRRAVLHGLLTTSPANLGDVGGPVRHRLHRRTALARGHRGCFWPSAFSQVSANHFVIAYKGQPVVPADLFALSTAAAAVSGGYSFCARRTRCWSHAAVLVRCRLHRPALRPAEGAALADAPVAANAAMRRRAGGGMLRDWWLDVLRHRRRRTLAQLTSWGEWNTRASYAEPGDRRSASSSASRTSPPRLPQATRPKKPNG